MQLFNLKFDEQAISKANAEWGCNCGPSALAAILGKTLDEIRPIVEAVGFADRGYMNVTMMRECCGAMIHFAPREILKPCDPPVARSNFPCYGLVRIQLGGPWIKDGKPQKWAATATHWVASIRHRTGPHLGEPVVFDVNGGPRRYEDWEANVLPAIMASIKRCDGTWYPTHSWEIESGQAN